VNLIFDLETDGLYDDATKIHCIGIYDLDTEQTLVFNDEGSEQPISKGIQLLEDADALIGHNIVGYDLPVIRKLYPWFTPNARVVDTLVLSRIYHADMLKTDQKRKWGNMPPKLLGRHSLESYGYRLGVYKGEFGKDTDWKEWSEEMQNYMIQDVVVTTKLWNHFQPYLAQPAG
jgi:hypothetical protein